jgi:predicted N-acetyltransferase YhbS
MYSNAAFHNEQGAWQMIFGVNTLPEYRRQGLAGQVIRRVIADARAQGRKGCVLTCKEALLHYYETFGFVNEGVSESVHGGVVWYEMRLIF